MIRARSLPPGRVTLVSMLEPRIQQHFFESADLSYQAAEAMARPIADAAQAIVDCVTAGGRIWVHGRGVAQAPAQLLGAALSGRFERERPGLAAMVLAVDPLLLSEARGVRRRRPGRHPAARAGPGGRRAGRVRAASRRRAAGHRRRRGPRARDERAGHRRPGTGRQWHAAAGGPRHHRPRPTSGSPSRTSAPARICELQLLTLHALCDAVDLQLLGDADL